jgi:hypothetical protein
VTFLDTAALDTIPPLGGSLEVGMTKAEADTESLLTSLRVANLAAVHDSLVKPAVHLLLNGRVATTRAASEKLVSSRCVGVKPALLLVEDLGDGGAVNRVLLGNVLLADLALAVSVDFTDTALVLGSELALAAARLAGSRLGNNRRLGRGSVSRRGGSGGGDGRWCGGDLRRGCGCGGRGVRGSNGGRS